ncbi:MAG: hypothetical protein IPH17_06530 [Bacteroidales bacterium]|nr:hypothetical protein [Bacteroidales bacterium]
MKRTVSIALIISLSAIFIACKNSECIYCDKIHRGKLIDSIKLANTNYKYSAYIPERYKHKKLPTFIFFDPHGHPELAMKKYKSIADSLGVIFIGYTLSSNETPANFSLSYFEIFIRDINRKLPVDTAKLFFVGFSGGSRVATIVQEQFQPAKGLILTGASAYNPEFYSKNMIPIVHIVGIKDFNFSEFFHLFTQYANSPSIAIIFFDGKHHWPPQNIVDLAIKMLIFDKTKMKKQPNYSLDSIPEFFLYPTLLSMKKFNFLTSEDQLIKSYEIFSKKTMPILFDIFEKEWSEQQKIINFFNFADDKKLIKYIDSLRNISLNSNHIIDEMNYALAQRLLSFIGIISFSYSANLFQQNNPAMQSILNIYEYIEPDNKDMLYFQVKWHLKNNDSVKANFYLQKLILYIQISMYL